MKKKLLTGLVVGLMGIGLALGTGCNSENTSNSNDNSGSSVEAPAENYQIVVSGDSVLEAMEEALATLDIQASFPDSSFISRTSPLTPMAEMLRCASLTAPSREDSVTLLMGI